MLSWSLRTLTADQRTAFALLGVVPCPNIGLPAAASLTALPPARARTTLRALEEASLLERRVGDRYAMHDLIHDYATTTADQDLAQDVQDAALTRLLDFYIHTAYTAERLLDPDRPDIPLDQPASGTRPHPFPTVPQAMAWFEAEHGNLLAAQRTAANRAWHLSVWQLAWALSTFHIRRGHRHDELTTWRAALDAAAHLPDPATRIRAHRGLGAAYLDLERYGQAVEHLNQALAAALADGNPDVAQQAHTHHVLAQVWERQGDDTQALHHATRALGLILTLDQPTWEADARNTAGWYAARVGQYDGARLHCQSALELYRRHDAREGAADTLDSLGYIEDLSGHHAQAVEYYQQSVALLRDLGNTYQTANTLDRLGRALLADGRHKQADAAWREAAQLYRQQARTTAAERLQRQLDELDPPGAMSTR